MERYLYHGTSAKNWQKIMANGEIRPRKPGSKGNWPGVISGLNRVYLTDSWGLYYAEQVTRGDQDLAVIRIDALTLDPSKLYPDEDWIFQRYCRDNKIAPRGPDRPQPKFTKALAMQRPDLAELSLTEYGTIAHEGPIFREALDAVAFVKGNLYSTLCLRYSHDPVVSMQCRAFLGPKYKGWMEWLFGGDPQVPDLGGGLVTYPPDHNGVSVISCR